MTIDPFALAAVLDITDGVSEAYYDGRNVVVRLDDLVAELDIDDEFPTVASGPLYRPDRRGNVKEMLASGISYDFEGDNSYDRGVQSLMDDWRDAAMGITDPASLDDVEWDWDNNRPL